MNRIKLTDTIFGALAKMANGNPGALGVLSVILKETERIDIDNISGGMGVIFMLDDMGIYGTDIYVLYSDICERKIEYFLAVLRAVQLGLFEEKIIIEAASKQDRSGKEMIPVKDLYEQVRKELPYFNSINEGVYNG